MSGLESGVYVVKIMTDGGMATKRMVKM
ncbi:MAG: T9SS type A sorting domain-containing protein [Bacteroidales bacterium]|nr:T9SS type A sorting domain-containing protein [Bacteroidales bacterium]